MAYSRPQLRQRYIDKAARQAFPLRMGRPPAGRNKRLAWEREIAAQVERQEALKKHLLRACEHTLIAAEYEAIVDAAVASFS